MELVSIPKQDNRQALEGTKLGLLVGEKALHYVPPILGRMHHRD
jgi:hypothetical protein